MGEGIQSSIELLKYLFIEVKYHGHTSKYTFQKGNSACKNIFEWKNIPAYLQAALFELESNIYNIKTDCTMVLIPWQH